MSLIVTLTSTSTRLPVLRHTLLSLLDQSHTPDRIVVCISKEPYLIDRGIDILPDWFQLMLDNGEVEVDWVENTGPYRKLIPVYRLANDDDWIVTCDDDVIYGAEWLASLVEAGKAHPNAIVCGRAKYPACNPWKGRQSYLHWPLVAAGSIGKELLPIGIAGVLYRKPLLDDGIMLSNDFKQLAPKQDDLWFNLARQLAGTSVVVAPETNSQVYPIEAPGALSATNAKIKSAGWDNFIKALYDRIFVKFKGYLGMPVCGNDIAIRRLDEYRRNLGR